MSSTRRTFLKLIGGGTILAAGGLGTFALTREPTVALAPWRMAGKYKDYRKRALSYALLAPNPHNRQPWMVDLTTADQAIIYRDKTRNLEFTDPFDRQLTIGMGCFIELLVMAAKETRHRTDLDLFPEGEDGPVAIARFVEDGSKTDPLFRHVLQRRSCKEPFQDRAIATAEAQQLANVADIVTDEKSVAILRQLTLDAWLKEAHTPRTLKESVDLFRIGKAEINANPDGIDLGGPMLETLALFGLLTRASQLDPSSDGFRRGVEMYTEMLSATPNYAMVKTPTNTRQDQINAGRQWVRLNLLTTQMGLSLHPVSQALQEFPEMKAHHSAIHKLFAADGETIQMLGRLGYGPKLPATPRWPLETRLRDG